MRLLTVLHLGEAGGPPQHVRPWLAELRADAELEVVAPSAGPALDLYADIATTRVLPYESLMMPSSGIDLATTGARLSREIRMFREHVRVSQPDAVLAVTAYVPAAVLAARLARVPAIVYASEFFARGFDESRLRDLGVGVLRRVTQSAATAIVACSRAVARQFDARRVVTIYPGVAEAAPGDARGFRARWQLEDADPCLALVGNVAPGRAQDVAMRALALVAREFPRAKCVVVGATLDRPIDRAHAALVREVADAVGVADRVVYTGFVDDVRDVYAAADIVVNPARVNEGLGRVALEALAAVRPVVSTRVGAVPEVLRDGVDALLVPPESPAELAAAIVRIHRDTALRDRLVAAGRARMLADFSERRGAQEFAELVRAVVAGSGGRRQRGRPRPGAVE